MFNDYYSSIGLDKLTPGCINPNLAENSVGTSNDDETAETDGEYEYQTHIVNKIYAVKRGEHLADIAARFGCSLKDMKSWNHLRYGKVVAGQRLLVKVVEKEKVWVTKSADASPAKEEEKTTAVVKATKPKETTPKIIYHIVHPGDTLFNIAKRYSVNDIEVLKSVNGLSDGKSLKVGMKIKVPVNG
jgi:LysM repeat protein